MTDRQDSFDEPSPPVSASENSVSGSSGSLPAGFRVADTYEIIRELGAGGMGTVYLVNHVLLKKEFALKTVNRKNLEGRVLARFHQEARAAALLNHPNIVEVTDFGLLDDERPFLVMELVKGTTLSRMLKKYGRFTPEIAGFMISQVCSGLAHAHRKGIVHRDIKPTNIIVDYEKVDQEIQVRSIKVVDLGIAKLLERKGGEIQSLTQTGEIFGSPYYMSPEQVSGSSIDHRADIYSAGCVLFECLTGGPPFRGNNALETMIMHQSQTPRSLREATASDFDPLLETLVSSMLAKHPDARPQSLEDVKVELTKILGDSTADEAARTAPEEEITRTGENQSTRRGKVWLLVLLLVPLGLLACMCFHNVNKAGEDNSAASRSNLAAKDSLKAKRRKQKPPFARFVRKEGVRLKEFHLPREIGLLEVEQRVLEPVGPEDHYLIADQVPVSLQVRPDYQLPVQFFSKFENGTINKLKLSNNDSLRNDHLAGLSHLSSLSEIDLSKTEITDAGLEPMPLS